MERRAGSVRVSSSRSSKWASKIDACSSPRRAASLSIGIAEVLPRQSLESLHRGVRLRAARADGDAMSPSYSQRGDCVEAARACRAGAGGEIRDPYLRVERPRGLHEARRGARVQSEAVANIKLGGS